MRKLRTGAKLPSFAHEDDAAADLYACIPPKRHPSLWSEDGWTDGTTIELRPDVVHTIGTGIAVEIPPGYEGVVMPRSGMSKSGIFIANSPGLIDAGYRGEVKVLLYTHHPYRVITHGDRIAQLRVRPVPKIKFSEVSILSSSERGTGGFGSTGK